MTARFYRNSTKDARPQTAPTGETRQSHQGFGGFQFRISVIGVVVDSAG
jgi:hypothetical protein